MIVLLLLLSPVHAQSVVAMSSASPDTIRLSESVTVRLALEGPSPLRVDLPSSLLTKESAKGWRIRPLGPAVVEKLDGGRERWVQLQRLDPFDVPLNAPGTIAFSPVSVNRITQMWPPVNVTVGTKITEARPETAHPVTSIEDLPPRPPVDHSEVGWFILAGAALVFLAVLVLGLVRRARAKPPPLPPREWAIANLDDALRERSGRELADRVAEVLRMYVESARHLPAPRLTTAELCREAEAANWPVGLGVELVELLDRCDRAKFAGQEPDTEEGHELVQRAKRWVSFSVV